MSNIKKNTELTRVNINLPTNIVEKVKDYADNLGINTTSAYIVLLNQALEYKDSISYLNTIIELSQKIENQQKKD